MSIQSEIERISGNVADAYSAVAEKGGTVPETPNSDGLPEAVRSIPAGEITAFLVKAPVGTIVIWSGSASNIPAGWALCDGQDGRPDLRDKFVLGGGGTHPVGDSGGEETHTLTIEEMPEHKHTLEILSVQGTNDVGFTGFSQSRSNNSNVGVFSASLAGGSQPHNNMPPYYTLCYIMKTTADETDGTDYLPGDGVRFEETETGTSINLETPVQGLTRADFDALPEEKKDSGVYFLTDTGDAGGTGGTGGSGGSGGEIYSTEETRIGTWIDGKPLYRKVVKGSAGDVGTFQAIANLTSLSIDTAIRCYGFYITSNGYVAFPNTMGSSSDDKSFLDIETSTWSLRFKTTMANVAYRPVTAIVEYTKTTDKAVSA